MATVLGLLLVVTFLANYLTSTLVGQMQGVEFDHELLVQDELERLQTEIVAAGEHGATPLPLTAPIELGSAAVPPFGNPASGTLFLNAAPANDTFTYGLAHYLYVSPVWGQGTLCSYGQCTSISGGLSASASVSNACSPPVTYNFTGSDESLQITVSGSNDCYLFNVLGDHDLLTFSNSGSNTVQETVVVLGNDDFVTDDAAGTGGAAEFELFGGSDRFNETGAGSSLVTQVEFIGEASQLCPYENQSSTDSFLMAGTGRLDTTNLTWYNNAGYQTSYHAVTSRGRHATGDIVGFLNESSGSLPCAFTTTEATYLGTDFGASVQVALDNRYIPSVDVSYRSGGVVEGTPGASGAMLSPPTWQFSPVNGGEGATLILVQFLGTPVEEGGVATALVALRVMNEVKATMSTSSPVGPLAPVQFLNITSRFPSAWITYLHGLGSIVEGIGCMALGPIAYPYTCLQPPPGSYVRLTATLSLVQLTIETVQIQASLATT